MSAHGNRYVVNETYRSSTDPEKDQFQGWLNAPIDTGIRNSGGIRAIANPETGDREFLVFITSDGSTKNPNPWEDVINMQEGTARYWGDAKARHRPDPDEATGNNWVKTDYTETYAQGNRKDAPPVLLFEQPETGQVTFRGLCILTGMSIERHKDDDGETVVNYLFDLAILDTDAVELEWIHRKARTGRDIGGPDAWQEWVTEGRIRRYSVWKDNIRSTAAQQPAGRYGDLLQDIRTRLDGPKKGEKLEYLIQYLMEDLENISDVEMTADSGDKGVDLTGRIELLSETQLGGVDTAIDFKAQVKNTSSSISGRQLSRLASRIDDGEIGLFFTTSYYTKSAQEENLSTYPVRLFSGKDLVELLVQTDLADDATLNDAVVADIEDEF
ncbi:restriction endonuclease [Halorientalis brevis]|uniref:Restriction endonuclease n=1 Tax=Halorientalis brevis TaxID=1126241 RepID=A0ABD6CFF4_9EURY|nr:restriction endonuclease [Halorientalis brevis]